LSKKIRYTYSVQTSFNFNHTFEWFSTTKDFWQPKTTTSLTLKESKAHQFDWPTKWRNYACNTFLFPNHAFKRFLPT